MKLKSMTESAGIESNNAPLKRIAMKMNARKMIPVMRKDLYSNPKQTMCQEILSNARDAHRQAGNINVPILVTLPTKHDSTLKIRDFGISMSPTQIEEIFSCMGNSSKDNNDDDLGGFGLGSKSPLAYVDAFTIVTYYEKMMRVYVCHIGENPEGDLDLHMEEPTEEPNGVEIQIAIQEKDIEAIKQAVYRSTLFWEVKPRFDGILADEIPSFIKEVTNFSIFKNDNWNIFQAKEINQYIDGKDFYSSSGGLILLVGGIPYRLSNHFSNLENVRRLQGYLSSSMTLTIAVGVKDVEINPNRENLMASDSSKDQVNKICGEVVKSIMEKISEEINQSKTFKEFIENHNKMNSTLISGVQNKITLNNVEYKLDKSNRLETNLLNHVRFERFTMSENRSGKKIVSREDTRSIYFSKSVDTKIVYMDIVEGPNNIRERVRNYFDGDLDKVVYIVHLANPTPPSQNNDAGFTPESDKLETFIKEVEAVGLSTLPMPEIAKGERQKRASTKGKICLHYFVPDTGNRRYSMVLRRESTHIEPEEIDDTAKYLYIELVEGGLPEKYKTDSLARMCKFLNDKGYTLIGVSSQVKAKLLEYELDIESYDDFIKTFNKKIPLTNEDKLYLKKKKLPNLGKLDILSSKVSEICDEKIKKIIQQHKEISAITAESQIPDVVLSYYEKDLENIEKEMKDFQSALNYAEAEYPLIYIAERYHYYDRHKESAIAKEFINYINLKHSSQVPTKKKTK